ncbi:hypothetical protein Clacol_000674 [Clathrus columnatus]|uniref:Uncharacterized protein n=1 Tax=Clathrus columnatus TaxID=1419009 RepID=A0AAV4ZX12_9AGAM|nr:hypothetical protein Clacol_000674 [Clathrus columnatus]
MLEATANIVVPDMGNEWHMLRNDNFSAVDFAPSGTPPRSVELMDLITHMMRSKPADRLTSQGVYDHVVVARARKAMENKLVPGDFDFFLDTQFIWLHVPQLTLTLLQSVMVVLETPLRGRRPDIHRLRTCKSSDNETGSANVYQLSSSSPLIGMEPSTIDNGNEPGSPIKAVNSASVVPSDAEMKTYTSLPPSPVSLSPPRLSRGNSKHPTLTTPFSIWDYLREELLATDFDSHQELKWERVSNFLSIPLAVEKTLLFGCILCFDSLLYSFTVLPIRFSLAVTRLLRNVLSRTERFLPPSQKADILRALLIVFSIIILMPFTDVSKIYHSIRGQETIKLYVIFNALEVYLMGQIADRLCTSFGQDIIDCLFSRSTLLPLSRRQLFGTPVLRPLLYFALVTAYTVAHTLVLIYQLTSLNVAINSYDHSLLTLLVSNQFVEIKGSVFKRFEKDNLFQILCADIVERFQLSLMLLAIAARNLIEISGSELDPTESLVLPQSFGWSRRGNLVWRVFSPVMTVLLSEILVDWLKHAFITKFNHIRPSVYERYTDVLCRDLASGSAIGRKGFRKHTYVDQSPLVARRLGFAAIPMTVLCIIIGGQCFALMHDMGTGEIITSPVIIGVHLITYATLRKDGMETRAAEDAINDFGRDPIGEGKEERKYNRELKVLLGRPEDDALPVAEIGEQQTVVTKDGKKRPKLEDLTRFTMVKRIW